MSANPTNAGWIGVDLGTRAIKLAQLARDGAGVRLARRSIVPCNASGIDDVPAWPATSSQRARALQAARFLEPSFSGTSAAALLPMQLTTLRTFEVSDEGGSRRSIVAQQLAGFLEGSVEGFEFDYWDLAAPGQHVSRLNDVAVLFVDRDIACQAARELLAAGMECHVIDGLPTVMARAVTLAWGTTADAVAAVDWGHGEATFCVVARGEAVFTRSLRQCGFARLLDAAAAALGLSTEDVRRLLSLYGLPGPARDDANTEAMQQILGDITSRPLDEMRRQLAKTLAYLNVHRASLMPRRICLMGGGATIRNVAPWLSERLDVAVETWQFPAGRNSEPDTAGAPPSEMPLWAGAAALSALAWAEKAP
jgi:Tfp pilus assembly PilM family ATPase